MKIEGHENLLEGNPDNSLAGLSLHEFFPHLSLGEMRLSFEMDSSFKEHLRKMFTAYLSNLIAKYCGEHKGQTFFGHGNTGSEARDLTERFSNLLGERIVEQIETDLLEDHIEIAIEVFEEELHEFARDYEAEQVGELLELA